MFFSTLLLGLASLPFFSQCNAQVSEPFKLFESFEYQVSVKDKSVDFHLCTGALVHTFYVITVAQCVYKRPVNTIVVAAGLRYFSSPEYVVGLSEIIVHEMYGGWFHYINDIAILRLSSPIYTSPTIKHVKIIENDEFLTTGYPMIISGFTQIDFDRYKCVPMSFAQSQVYALAVNKCMEHYVYKTTNFCAIDACNDTNCVYNPLLQDNMGGLLVVNERLVGLLSDVNRRECMKDNDNYQNPIIFTRLSSYNKWIGTNVLLTSIYSNFEILLTQ